MIFDDILAKGARAGQMPGRNKAARTWYRKMATAAGRPTMPESKDRTRSGIEVGSMFCFNYDPKHKKTLPYYDRFPLCIPIGPAKNGFYGINLHYLPPPLRAKMMDALYKVSSDKNYDENTKLRISYDILRRLTRVKYYKPTVKHYLNKHVRSNFIYIFPSEWDIALFLDTQKFEKASTNQVWQDSRRMMN